MKPYRVLVTGSRTWHDADAIADVLSEYVALHPTLVIVHGACPLGADAIADAWARGRRIRVERFPADWNRYGRSAGYIRNRAMVDTRPDVCLAFIRDHSRGATHCATYAQARDVPTHIYDYPPDRTWKNGA